MLHKRLEDLPPPLAVDYIACEPPHDEQALDRLRALKVMRVARLDDDILRGVHDRCAIRARGVLDVEVRDLGRETRGGDAVHLVAGVHELARQVQVVFLELVPQRAVGHFPGSLNGDSVGCAEREHARDEADEMVHFGVEREAADAGGELAEDGEVAWVRGGEEVLFDPRHGFCIHSVVDGLGFSGL